MPKTASSKSELARIRAVLDRCRDDPALFQTAVLGRQLWSAQVAVCDAVAQYPITVVPSGRATGKSFCLAGLVLWFLFTRRDSLVLITAPDHRQTVTVLWKELRRALRPRYANGRQVSPRIPLAYEHMTTGTGSPQRLTIREGGSWQALAFSARTGEGFSGQHQKELMILVDEASGVDAEIWEAIHGAAATRLVVSGNPIRHDCHFRELAELGESGSASVKTVRISSLDHPDAAKEVSEIGAISASALRQLREIHGEDSPWWRSNILGLFPGQESVQFFPAAWLDACADPVVLQDELWREYPDGPTRMGVDIGGGVGADPSVVIVRNDKQVLAAFCSAEHGVLDDAKHRLEPVVAELARKYSVHPSRIVYDKAGLGRNFGSYLEKHGLSGSIGYFGAGRGGKLFANMRTACAFAIKRRLDPHREGHVPLYCGIPEWPALRRELAALRGPDMVMEEGAVKQKIEDKADLNARLKHSSNYLDALLMCFALAN